MLELREISEWTGRSVQEARSRQEGSKSNPPPAGLLSGEGEGGGDLNLQVGPLSKREEGL